MTDPTPSTGRKALEYAENTLGVHLVYEDAEKARKLLDGILDDIGVKRDAKRTIEGKITDREMDILSDERSKHSDMSAAAMDKHLKLAYHEDPTLQQLRSEHLAVINDLDGLELDRAMAEIDIRIAVARLTELGGYFQYLAAIKNEATNTYHS